MIKLPIRLAMRVEGDWWVAYMAQAETMEGAHRLGSILMTIVENNQDREHTFIALMQSAMTDAITDATGIVPEWDSAPDAE